MCKHWHCPQMVPSVRVIGNTFVLVAANISVLWSILLNLHIHVCRCVKLIQVRWACPASTASPPPPCGWVPCRGLWRQGMVATALTVTCVVGRQGPGRECEPIPQPHWPWSAKVNNYKTVGVIPCRGTVFWVRQTAWCGSTFHMFPGQSLPPGPPAHPPPATFRERSFSFGFLSAAQKNSFLWGSASFYASPPQKNTINTELLVVSHVFYKVVFTAPYLSEKNQEMNVLGM